MGGIPTMNEKKWIQTNILISSLVILPVILYIMIFNFIIDPYWYFNHKNEWNDYQLGFDERELRTNKVVAEEKEYNALLIGTSRLTYWNQYSFEENQVFNYSLSSMALKEYVPYIKFAEENLKGDINKVYLEIYYGSFDNQNYGHKPPSDYLTEKENVVDKIKKMYSVETYKRARENFNISRENKFDGPRTYNRDNVGSTTIGNYNYKPLLEKIEKSNVDEREPVTADFNEYRKTLRSIEKETKHLEVLPMTEMIPMGRLAYIWSYEKDKEIYKKWIKTTVNEFGELYIFHKTNKFTTDGKYWFDLHHYYPEVAEEMIKAMENPSEHKDIVEILTEDNVDEFLLQLENEINEYNIGKK
jgi:hypothetical protein